MSFVVETGGRIRSLQLRASQRARWRAPTISIAAYNNQAQLTRQPPISRVTERFLFVLAWLFGALGLARLAAVGVYGACSRCRCARRGRASLSPRRARGNRGQRWSGWSRPRAPVCSVSVSWRVHSAPGPAFASVQACMARCADGRSTGFWLSARPSSLPLGVAPFAGLDSRAARRPRRSDRRAARGMIRLTNIDFSRPTFASPFFGY